MRTWTFALAMAGMSGAPDEKPADAPMEIAPYFVGLITRGPAWSPDKTPERDALQAAHLAGIERLTRSGKLVLAGPFPRSGDLRGLFIFNVETREEAEALVQSDPAVQAGRLRVELHPWWGTARLKTLHAGDPELSRETETEG